MMRLFKLIDTIPKYDEELSPVRADENGLPAEKAVKWEPAPIDTSLFIFTYD